MPEEASWWFVLVFFSTTSSNTGEGLITSLVFSATIRSSSDAVWLESIVQTIGLPSSNGQQTADVGYRLQQMLAGDGCLLDKVVSV